MLIEIEPFISFGIPSRSLLNEVVVKKGMIGVSERGRPRRLTSNDLVERALGKYGVICLNDMVEVLASSLRANEEWKEAEDQYVVMPNGERLDRWDQFEAVVDALNPIQLNWSKMAMKGMTTPFGKCGYWGHRGSFISNLVEKLI